MAIPAVLLVLTGPQAAAVEMSTSEFRSLAVRAMSDPDAVGRIRTVTSVDGRAVDVASALSGADGENLRARLEALVSRIDATPVDVDAADAAARRAARIVEAPPYTPRALPRPFRGALTWLGDRVAVVTDPVGRFLGRLADALPGGRATLGGIVGVLIMGAAAVLTALTLGRRGASAASSSARHRPGGDRDPGRLEGEADQAERNGDLETAIRLRFTAGLLRLHAAGAIEYRPSITTGDVARRLRLRSFGRLGRTHDEVVYGRRPPRPQDVEASRTGWTEVLEIVKR